MKVHRHLVEETFAAVLEIFRSGKPADKVIEAFMKTHKKWGARDRRFFAECVYEIVRHWRRLWNDAGLSDADYLDRESIMPSHVQAVWVTYWQSRGEETPDWCVERPRPARKDWPTAIQESVPDWLEEMGRAEFGSEWPAVIASLNKPADVYLRTNTLKTTRAELMKALAAEEIETEPAAKSEVGLRLPVRKNVFVTQAFKKGFFEVQDLASQTVAPLLDPKPGDRVIDACAGAGGKSLHLAALMKNKGKLISLDIHEWKLGELRHRASRNGVDCIETRVIDSTKVIKRLDASADRVLLDVPCSGLGVLRRNPDTKWRLTPEEITRMQQLQREILSSYSRMVKPGGVLVYATCSLMPAENSRQVNWFLGEESGRSFRLEREENHRPDIDGTDGFYAARLVRS